MRWRKPKPMTAEEAYAHTMQAQADALRAAAREFGVQLAAALTAEFTKATDRIKKARQGDVD